MSKSAPEPVSYTNRKGKTYYLHATVRKTGRTHYAMKATQEGALSELPEGYVITENVKGIVSVGRVEARVISEEEESVVVAHLERLGLNECRCEARRKEITVFEPAQPREDLLALARAFGASSAVLDEWLAEMKASANMMPVMRFRMVDTERRIFDVDRMSYFGSGGWFSLRDKKPLPALAKKYLPHLGKESFYELT